MTRWLRSLFAWREVECLGISGVWHYSQNAVTGERKALRISGGWQPVDLNWLEAGNGYRIIDGIGRLIRVRASVTSHKGGEP